VTAKHRVNMGAPFCRGGTGSLMAVRLQVDRASAVSAGSRFKGLWIKESSWSSPGAQKGHGLPGFCPGSMKRDAVGPTPVI
jgi:hypothetical protein